MLWLKHKSFLIKADKICIYKRDGYICLCVSCNGVEVLEYECSEEIALSVIEEIGSLLVRNDKVVYQLPDYKENKDGVHA